MLHRFVACVWLRGIGYHAVTGCVCAHMDRCVHGAPCNFTLRAHLMTPAIIEWHAELIWLFRVPRINSSTVLAALLTFGAGCFVDFQVLQARNNQINI